MRNSANNVHENLWTYDWLENECRYSHVMQVQIFKMSVNYE